MLLGFDGERETEANEDEVGDVESEQEGENGLPEGSAAVERFGFGDEGGDLGGEEDVDGDDADDAGDHCPEE